MRYAQPKMKLIGKGCLAIIVIVASGCDVISKSAGSDTASSTKVSSTTGAVAGAPGKPAGGSTSSSNTDPGIVPLGGAAITPVTNPGAVEGVGSGVGESAKGAAKAAAEKAAQSPAATNTDNE